MDNKNTGVVAESNKISFGLPSDLSTFVDSYSVWTNQLKHPKEIKVSDLERSGVSHKDLYKSLKQDMKKRPKLGLNIKKGDGEEWVPEFTDLILKGLKKFVPKEIGGDRFCGSYHIVALKSKKAISYTYAIILLEFDAEGLDLEFTNPNEIIAWIESGAKEDLNLSVTVFLEDAYTLSEHRGAGACSATMAYVKAILLEGLGDVLETTSPYLARANKFLKIEIVVKSDLFSKSGGLACSHLHDELEDMRYWLNEMVLEKAMPVQLPECVEYDAG